MAGNIPNVSADTLQVNKLYDSLRLQQGVPILDSDWNEQGDILQLASILQNHYMFGRGRLPALPDSSTPGYFITAGTPTSNNFQIWGGWAVVEGVLVPTIMEYPPGSHDYEDDTNIMGEGIVTGVAGGKLSDANQNWQTFHDLVGCRIKMTSGAESGNSFTITVRDSTTQVTLSGGTGSIGVDDTYIIKPPVLTTPSGSDRTDEVYVMVWWEDINENEDTGIVNVSLGIETCHRRQRRWCVRVAEDDTTPSTPDRHSFGVRYMQLATLERPDSDATITASKITNTWNTLYSYSSFCSADSPVPILQVVSGLSSAIKFQLSSDSTKWFVGTAANDETRFFTLYADGDGTPLMGSDNRAIIVSALYDSTDDHQIDTGDIADGYVVDPYIYLDFTNTVDTDFTGTIYVRAAMRNTAGNPMHDEYTGDPLSVLNIQTHSDNIHIGNEGTSGTPEYDRFYWTGSKTLQGGLDTLVDFLNKLVVDERSPSDWTLLWRSHDIREDANVTANTISIYFMDAGYLLVVGGYIDSGVVKAGSGTNVEVMVLGVIDENPRQILFASKNVATGGTAIDTLDDATGWGNYHVIEDVFDGTAQEKFYKPVEFGNTIDMIDLSASGGSVGLINLLNNELSRIRGANLSGNVVRKFLESFGGTITAQVCYQDNTLWIFCNIEYNTDGGKEFAMQDDQENGLALRIEKDEIIFYYVPSSAGYEQADWDMDEWYPFAVHRWGENTGSTNLAYHLIDVADEEINHINSIVSPAIVLVRNMNTTNSAMFFYSNGVTELVSGDSSEFSHTVDTEAKINVYYSTTLDCQNKTNAVIDIKIAAFGIAHLTS